MFDVSAAPIMTSVEHGEEGHVCSDWAVNTAKCPLIVDGDRNESERDLTLCAVTANCSALFIMSAVLSSARPSRSPRSFRAWLAFCTALVTLSAAECRMLLPADGGERKRRMWIIITSLEFSLLQVMVTGKAICVRNRPAAGSNRSGIRWN